MGQPKKAIIQPIQPTKTRTFEQCYDEILSIIESRKFKWHLDAIKGWYEWEDVRSHLLAHIARKWHLFNQAKSLRTWVMVVVTNQQINLLRNFYMSHAKPCIALKCPEYEGGDMCRKFGTCNCDCSLYCAWTKKKKLKHEINLPLSLENHINESNSIQHESIDIEKTGANLHARMKEILKPFDWKIYELLFVKHMSEESVGKLLKYKSNEPNRNPGYKQLSNIKKRIMALVKDVLRKEEIEIIR